MCPFYLLRNYSSYKDLPRYVSLSLFEGLLFGFDSNMKGYSLKSLFLVYTKRKYGSFSSTQQNLYFVKVWIAGFESGLFWFCSIVGGSESKKRFCCSLWSGWIFLFSFFIYFNWGFGFSFVLEVWIEFMWLDSIRGTPTGLVWQTQTDHLQQATSATPRGLAAKILHKISIFRVPSFFSIFYPLLLSLCFMLFTFFFFF